MIQMTKKQRMIGSVQWEGLSFDVPVPMYHETKQEVKAGGMEGMQPKITNTRMIRMIIQTQATIHTLTIDYWLDLNAWNICYRMSVSGR